MTRKRSSLKYDSEEDATSPEELVRNVRSLRTRRPKPPDPDVEDEPLSSTEEDENFKDSSRFSPLSSSSRTLRKRDRDRTTREKEFNSRKRRPSRSLPDDDEEEGDEDDDEDDEGEDHVKDDPETEELVKKICIPHFTLPTRGQGKVSFCLGMDLAKYVGVAKSFALFIQYPELKKYTANEEEKEKLYELGFLPVQLRRKTKTVIARLKNVIETVGKDYDLFDKSRMDRPITEEEDSDLEEDGNQQESAHNTAVRHKYASYLSNFQRSRDPLSHRASIVATAKDHKWIYNSAKSSSEFNRHLNEERKNRKFQFYDMHTNIYQVSQMVNPVLEVLYDLPPDDYPIAFYPGQLQHYIPLHKDRFPNKIQPDPPSYTMPLRPCSVPTTQSLPKFEGDGFQAQSHQRPYMTTSSHTSGVSTTTQGSLIESQTISRPICYCNELLVTGKKCAAIVSKDGEICNFHRRMQSGQIYRCDVENSFGRACERFVSKRGDVCAQHRHESIIERESQVFLCNSMDEGAKCERPVPFHNARCRLHRHPE